MFKHAAGALALALLCNLAAAQFGGSGWSGGGGPGGGWGGSGWNQGGGGNRCRENRPLAPRNLRWRSTATTVEVVWDKPSGDACVDFYSVRIRPAGMMGIFQEQSPRIVSGTGVVVTGLDANKQYLVEVQAVNRRFGPGPMAGVTTKTQAPTPQCNNALVPGVPASLKATSNAATTLDLVWEKPKNNPTACIDGYKVEAYDATTGTKVFSSSYAGDILKTTLPGLQANTKYRITVNAINKAGAGLPAVANAQTKPGPPPSCRSGVKPANPVALGATPDGLDKLVLSWSTIPDGVCIDDFKVTGVEVATGKPVADIMTTITNTSAVLLTPGVEYRFTVTSRNKAGFSAPATITASIPKPVPIAPSCDIKPASPINVTAIVNGTDRIILNWINGNDSICVDAYNVRGVETVSGKGALTVSTIYPNATAVQLVPGVNYTFTIVAVNKKGESAPVTVNAFIPKPEPVCNIKPAAPINFTAVPDGDSRIRLSWANGNDSICVDGYSVRGVETVSGKGALTTQVISSVTNATATQLTPGVNYTFTIFATNKVGQSAPVTITAVIPKPQPVCTIKPAAPINFTAVPDGDSKIVLSWANGNDSICVDGYSIRGFETVSGKGALTTQVISSVTNTTAVMLTPGVNYTFAIFATNKVGQSEPVTITAAIPKNGPAGCMDGVANQVRNLEAKLGGPGELTLNWKVPKNNICIKQYVVLVKETGEKIVVAPKNEKQDGQLKFKAPMGQEGKPFTFVITPFSAPSGKEGASLTSQPFPTPFMTATTGRRLSRRLMALVRAFMH